MSLIKLTPAVFALAACSSHKPEAEVKPAAPVAVTTVAVQPVEWADTIEAPGTVRARTSALITSRAMGYVVAVGPRVGDRVTAGQTLVELDATELQTAIQAARAQLAEVRQGIPEADSAIAGARAQVELAEATLRRLKDLLDKRSVSPQEFDEAQARANVAHSGEAMARARRRQVDDKIKQVEEGVRAAEVMASYATVRAPFTGRVVARKVEPGALAAPGTPLLEVEQDGGWLFEAAIEESRLSLIERGQRVTVRLEAIPQTLAGRVTEIVPSVEEASRTFLAKIDLPAHRDLRSGLFGRASFPAGQRRSVLSVPAAAVITQGQLQSVLVADGGIARSRLVRLGAFREGRFEVLSGLQAGDRIIHPRPAALADGARVETRP